MSLETPQSLDSPWSTDPLLGAEVLRVSLEANGVYIHFETNTLMLYGPVEVQRIGHPDGSITPLLRQGDLEALWALVGLRIAHVQLGDVAEFTFDGGTTLRLPEGTRRGEIVSTPNDGTVGWDEF